MKRPNNLTISLPQDRLEQLERLSQDGESIGQCAKRLLLALLDGERPAPMIAPDELSDIRERLEAIEVAIDHEHFPSKPEELGETWKRINAIEDRLTAIESHGSAPVFPGDQPITDQGQWVICLTLDDKPVKYWTGSEWSEEIASANRYQSETSLKRTLEKLKTRKRDDPTTVIRYNTIANLEKILGDKQ